MPKHVKTKWRHRESDLMPITNLPNTDSKAAQPKQPFWKKIHPSVHFTIAILILLYASLNIWIYFYGTKIFTFNPLLQKTITNVSVVKQQGGFGQLAKITPKPTPPPRVIYPLPTGKQEWTLVRAPDATGLTVGTATVDPLTPTKDQSQTVSITAKNDSPIQATATIFTDHKHQSKTMNRTAGSDTDGTWELTWTPNDTYENIYHIDFVLTSSTGNWTGTLTFR